MPPRRARGGLVVDVIGGGSEHHVAEHCRGDEHALGVRGGHRQHRALSSGRASLSNTINSPRRGRTVKPSRPRARWSSSPCRPAALTTNRVRTCVRRGRRDRCVRRRRRRSRPPRGRRRRRPVGVRLVGERQRRRPRIDDVLVGHEHPAGHARARGAARIRTPSPVDHLGVLVAVGGRLGGEAWQRRRLLVVPCHEQRAGLLRPRCPVGSVLAQQRVAAGHQPRLERARRGVESRVQDGGVGLARAGADVGPGLDSATERS